MTTDEIRNALAYLEAVKATGTYPATIEYGCKLYRAISVLCDCADELREMETFHPQDVDASSLERLAAIK